MKAYNKEGERCFLTAEQTRARPGRGPQPTARTAGDSQTSLTRSHFAVRASVAGEKR